MPEYSGLAQQILAYIKQRADAWREKFDKESEKKKRNASADVLPALEASLEEERQRQEDYFKPCNWLSDAARRAGQLQFVTHGLKFVHPDAKGTSVFADYSRTDDPSFISTFNIAAPDTDIVGNAAALDVGKLLMLEEGGVKLMDKVRAGDSHDLLPFAENEGQAQQWLQGLQQVFVNGEPESHKFAKQVYWPVGESGEGADGKQGQAYHLLSPLFATSFSHYLYQEIHHHAFSEQAKTLREQRKAGEYAEVMQINYLNLAKQSFGGTKPQNISQLNSQRGGKSYLFSCAPPNWQNIEKPPLNIDSCFSQFFERRVYFFVRSLQEYVESLPKASSALVMREARARGVDDIIIEILNYAAFVQNLPASWSANAECRLPRAEQLWLDPDRQYTDQAFYEERELDEWQDEVANNFARWLCHKLESETSALGKEEHLYLAKLFKTEIRLNLKNIAEIKL